MILGRVSKWVGIIAACAALVVSGAGAAMTIGGTGQRLSDVEQKVKDYQSDHDTLTRLDANMIWVVQRMGGSPK